MLPPSEKDRLVKRFRQSPHPTFVTGRWRPFVIAAAAIVLTAAIIRHHTPAEPPPDFAAIEDTNERKAAFIAHLLPRVRAVNDELRPARDRLHRIDETLAAGRAVGSREHDFVRAEAARHGIAPVETIDRALLARLLARVDTIPPSLVIAQAAIESGWGTSRFAREGNAFFGLRCHTPGCGMVPARRQPGATFEVAAYPDVRAAIRAYVHNLNSDPRYRSLRRLRAEQRAAGRTPSGELLAAGLVRYSEQGSDYIDLVRSVIRANDLARLD